MTPQRMAGSPTQTQMPVERRVTSDPHHSSKGIRRPSTTSLRTAASGTSTSVDRVASYTKATAPWYWSSQRSRRSSKRRPVVVTTYPSRARSIHSPNHSPVTQGRQKVLATMAVGSSCGSDHLAIVTAWISLLHTSNDSFGDLRSGVSLPTANYAPEEIKRQWCAGCIVVCCDDCRL